jgi:transcriptional regulator with XRE-family HTH domain
MSTSNAIDEDSSIFHNSGNQFGTVVKELRASCNMSQAEVVRQLGGKSKEWLSMIENCSRQIAIDQIPDLARVYRVDPDKLVVLALSQYYPKATANLFAGKTIKFKGAGTVTIQEPQDSTPELTSKALEWAKRFQKLSPQFQQMATILVKTLLRAGRAARVARASNRARKSAVES